MGSLSPFFQCIDMVKQSEDQQRVARVRKFRLPPGGSDRQRQRRALIVPDPVVVRSPDPKRVFAAVEVREGRAPFRSEPDPVVAVSVQFVGILVLVVIIVAERRELEVRDIVLVRQDDPLRGVDPLFLDRPPFRVVRVVAGEGAEDDRRDVRVVLHLVRLKDGETVGSTEEDLAGPRVPGGGALIELIPLEPVSVRVRAGTTPARGSSSRSPCSCSSRDCLWPSSMIPNTMSLARSSFSR